MKPTFGEWLERYEGDDLGVQELSVALKLELCNRQAFGLWEKLQFKTADDFKQVLEDANADPEDWRALLRAHSYYTQQKA